MSVRSLIYLFVTLALLPGQALAEGWDRFFEVMTLALLVSIYALAAQGVWWFLAGAILAWGFHIYRGADMERVHGLWPLGHKPGVAPTFGRALVWHLYALRWSLTVATLIAPIIISLGHAYGLSLKNKPNTVSQVNKGAPLAQQKWNRMTPDGGDDWPRATGYLKNMPIDAVQEDGGEIVLDNALGDSHFYARLCALYSPKSDLKSGCVVKRRVFIRRGESMRISQVAKGGYSIQVLDVLLGDAFVSPYIDWRQSTSETLTMDLPSDDHKHGFQTMPSGVFNAR